MRTTTRRQILQRGASGAVALSFAPWTARISVAGPAVLDTQRRTTCRAIAEVVADYPSATNDVRGAVENFVRYWESALPADRATMIQVVDAVEDCLPRGRFSAASKRDRAEALSSSLDDLLQLELPPGSKALMIERGLAGVAQFMVANYSPATPRPLPTY